MIYEETFALYTRRKPVDSGMPMRKETLRRRSVLSLRPNGATSFARIYAFWRVCSCNTLWIAGMLALFLSFPAAGCSRVQPPAGVEPIERTMEVTAYCSCGSCTGWRRNWYGRPVYAYGPQEGEPKEIGVTASGTKAGVGTIAADTGIYPFGTVMYVPGYGYGRVEDRGSAITGQKIDLYFDSHQEALEWGRRRETVKIWRQPE